MIVGAGAAGAVAAETLRRSGYTNSITLIGQEPPVDRPNLSKDYLAGTAPEEWMPLRSPDYYKKYDIELLVDRRVVRIDPGERKIELDDGNQSRMELYSSLPGRNQTPHPRGWRSPPCWHYLRSFEDSRRIIGALDGATHAAIIGAGFIGLEVAASLRHRGLEVSVIDPEATPLARVLGDTLGHFVRGLHEEKGVVFHLGRTVKEISPTQVMLDDGTTIPAGLVVIGIGVTPRVELAKEAGLEVDAGIVVNDRLRSSDPHIWAAGDVARYPDPRVGQVRVEHLGDGRAARSARPATCSATMWPLMIRHFSGASTTTSRST